MKTVKVSPKYQVVIPEEVRRELRIRKGQRLQIETQGGGILLQPIRPLSDFFGAVPGMSYEGMRDRKDRPL